MQMGVSSGRGVVHQQQQQTRPSASSGYPHHPSGLSTGGGTAMTASTSTTAGGTNSTIDGQRERKKKEQFLMFTRVLIKYLEQKDKDLHTQAKAIIKDCAEKNKLQTPGYESVTESMKRRLRELVGETYWKKAVSIVTDNRIIQGTSTSSWCCGRVKMKNF
jgi:hypothetical protein